MLDQIAAAEMAGSVLADEILEGMEKADVLEAAVAEVKARLDAGKNDLAKFRDTVAGEGQLVAGDITRLEADLAEAEKRLPTEFRDDYRRVIRGKGADGMAKMDAGVCEGCGKQVTLNMQNHLLLGKPVFCTACGRLLYPAER
jgi:predicted  nucleic acid-binding Zn-ribbon protein